MKPRLDVVGRTTQSLRAGTVLAATGHHHQIEGVEGLLVPARRAEGANAIPFYMMANNALLCDVPAGTIIAANMVVPPKESILWTLRREMEETFALR